MHVHKIARVCHAANRGYCLALGDQSQLPWDEAPEWQRQSAINGVLFLLDNPAAPPSATHESWLKEKREQGWKWGPTKNPQTKEHPCFVPYEELHVAQRAKDYIFQAIVREMARDPEYDRPGRDAGGNDTILGARLRFAGSTGGSYGSMGL